MRQIHWLLKHCVTKSYKYIVVYEEIIHISPPSEISLFPKNWHSNNCT